VISFDNKAEENCFLRSVVEFSAGHIFKQVFGNQQHFRIPDFQRPYSWEKKMWATLWIDIMNQYKVIADLRASGITESAIHIELAKRPVHYLGAIVTTSGNSMIPPPSDVLDGQQRLITSSVIYLALRDSILRKLGVGDTTEDKSKQVKESFASAFYNIDGTGDTKFRILTQDVDRSAWEYLLSNTRPVGLVKREHFQQSSGSSSGIIQAFNYFFKEMNRDGLQDSNLRELYFAEDLYPLDLNVLKDVISTRLSLVRIMCEANDDVNAIFESLNAKSEPLKQVDLIKNYIYISLPNEEASEVYKKSWRPMEKLIGSAKIERFVWAVVVSQGNTTLANRTYETVRSLLSTKPQHEIRKWVEDLAKEARYYKSIVSPESEMDKRVKSALHKVQRAGGLTAEPLLMYAYREWSEERATTDQLIDSIGSIESYLVRRMIAGEKTQVLNPIISTMLKRLHTVGGEFEASGNVAEDIRRVLSAPEADWPNSDRVKKGIREENFYKAQKSDQRQHVLQTLDLHLNKKSKNAVIPSYEDNDKSIEHIIPQTATKDWATGEDAQYPDELLERINTLANLTLLPSSVNASLGNSSWKVKRSAYNESGYFITKQIATDFSDSVNWDVSTLDQRSESLLSYIDEIWPRMHVAPKFVKDKKEAKHGPEMVDEFDEGVEELVLDEDNLDEQKD
jgi:hypothetical protein